jgi:hypothetical protein
VVAFLNDALFARVPMSSSRANRGPVHRHFHNVPAAAVDRSNLWECDAIPGSRSLHSISSMLQLQTQQVMVHFFLCFCGSCRRQMWDDCENKNYVESWRLVKIKRTQGLCDDR